MTVSPGFDVDVRSSRMPERILAAMAEGPEGGMTCAELASLLGATARYVRHHLGVLAEARRVVRHPPAKGGQPTRWEIA